MAVNWTEEQLTAINTEGNNILVAAAAGSGKTAVLVERIIRKICSCEKPVSVDRLLVLTYTEAAAAEMRRKVSDAIYEKMKSEPENKWLKEQSVLIHSSHISTVHAFCKAILQNNIHNTDLPAEFTLIDSTENEVLRNTALDMVLESYYAKIEKKKGFRDLAVGYGGVKNDDSLRNTVLKLHTFMRTLAYPNQWIKRACDNYKIVCESGSLHSTVWEALLKNACRDLAHDVMEGYKIIWETVEREVMSDHPFFSYFRDMPKRFAEAYAPILDGSADIDKMQQCAAAFKKGQARGQKDLEPDVADRILSMRKELVNEPLDKISQLLEAADAKKNERIIGCSPRIRALKQLVRQTEHLHKTMKREKNTLDFGDLEHEMLKLLSGRGGRPSVTAQKLKERFDEILVDEYQDTNNIQDCIFRLLSRDEKNIFMVGDLKQSIYKFRNADPGIFAEKYKSYSCGDGGVCIRLFKNFRSRSEVLDFANGIFDSVMRSRLGGLDYTKEEYLIRGADYASNAGDFTAELMITDTNSENYDPNGDFFDKEPAYLEALTTVRRIKKLVKNRELLITDKKTGELRPVRYGDITVLVRTKNNITELAAVMDENNIPYMSDSGRKYLDSIEVMTVLSFLQIIDNPRQDIPLLAVLRSALFNFSPEELAEIRLCKSEKGADFYAALLAAADSGNEKVSAFIKTLDTLRDDAVNMGVDELIQKICVGLGYINLVGAMPGGDIRRANLKLLYERSTEFEEGALSGLFNFMLYIESMRENGDDMIAAKPFSSAADTVSIMTIHKSKGLEFPVVILYGMQKYFNENDESRPVIWNEYAGIATDYIDTVRRIRYSCLPKILVRDMNIRELRSEELRLLYVALTRAKEKLILSCTVGKSRNKWKEAAFDSNGRLACGFAMRRTSMRDWVLSAILNHPCGNELRELGGGLPPLINTKVEYNLKINITNHENCIDIDDSEALSETYMVSRETNSMEAADIKERAEYKYPHNNLALLPIKMSVSELKRRLMPEGEYVPGVLRINTMTLSDTEEFGAAEIGTITHYIIQHIDLSKARTVAEVEDDINSMVKRGLINRRQADSIDKKRVAAFFECSLGKRLAAADKVYREFNFYSYLAAKELDPTLVGDSAEEQIMLQGIVDCFFYDEDGIVLIDYKTDRVSAGSVRERAENYRIQMEYYTRGLEKVLGVPVKERYLYFINCGEAIKI